MRIPNKWLVIPAAFLAILVSAYGQEVHYNYDRGADFAKYKTYQWVDLGRTVPDPLIDQSIKRAIDEQLAQKTSYQGGQRRRPLSRLPGGGHFWKRA